MRKRGEPTLQAVHAQYAHAWGVPDRNSCTTLHAATSTTAITRDRDCCPPAPTPAAPSLPGPISASRGAADPVPIPARNPTASRALGQGGGGAGGKGGAMDTAAVAAVPVCVAARARARVSGWAPSRCSSGMSAAWRRDPSCGGGWWVSW